MSHFIESYDPTIEDFFRKQVRIDDETCVLEVLDTAGQEEYTALRDQWIRDGDGFVLVYSVSSRASLQKIPELFGQIKRVTEPVIGTPPIITLVGNKCDQNTDRKVSIQEGALVARQFGCHFIETSAKMCTNVEKAFYDVVRRLREQQRSTLPSCEMHTNDGTKEHDCCDIRHKNWWNSSGHEGRETCRGSDRKCVVL